MHTLVIDNLPTALYNRIQERAHTQHCSPSDAVIEVLEGAFRNGKETNFDPPLPSPPFVTEEIIAPCSIPWPKGEVVVPIEVYNYLPTAHDC